MTSSNDRSRGIEGVDEFFAEPAEGHLNEWAGMHCPEAGPRLALLRCLLQASQGRLNAHEAAYKLGCSTRTLRRDLRHVGTTFQAEAQAARRTRHLF
jgi:Fic family protein